MRLTLILSLILLFGGVHAQKHFTNAAEYNDYIINEQRAIVKKNLDYISLSVHSEDYKQIENKRREVLKQINSSRIKMVKMGDYNGDKRLRDEALEVFDQYKNAFETDFKEVIQLKKNRQNSFEAMEAYFKAQNQAEDRVNKATQKFRKVQEKFAKENNLSFKEGTDDNLTRQMQTIADLNVYSRSVFLEYFKASKAFSEMLGVLNERKSAPLNKHRKRVIEVAADVVPNLKKLGAFNGDSDYLNQTISLVEYYGRLAENEFVEVVRIFDKKGGITQQDADYINKVLRDYNANAEMLVYNLNIANESLLQNNISPTQ